MFRRNERKKKVCPLCGREYTGYGNNPATLYVKGQVCDEWKTNSEYITEFVLVLNHKCWDWYNKNNAFSKLYADLYYKADQWCLDNLKGSDLEYYINTTD